MSKPPITLPPDVERFICDLIQAGKPMTLVGKTYGIPVRQVKAILAKHGVEVDRRSSMEKAWDTAWKMVPGEAAPYETQYRFTVSRQWKFDVAWPEYYLAVELHGGTWIQGRHNRPTGITTDAEKINAAIEQGWVVMVFTTPMLENDPYHCVTQVRRVLHYRAVDLRQLRAA